LDQQSFLVVVIVDNPNRTRQIHLFINELIVNNQQQF